MRIRIVRKDRLSKRTVSYSYKDTDKMRIRIRGKFWNFVFGRTGKKYDGHCEGPQVLNKTIAICEKLKGERKLDVIIHEILHAAYWDLSEEAIEETGRDLSRILWRLGYREVKDGQPLE